MGFGESVEWGFDVLQGRQVGMQLNAILHKKRLLVCVNASGLAQRHSSPMNTGIHFTDGAHFHHGNYHGERVCLVWDQVVIRLLASE